MKLIMLTSLSGPSASYMTGDVYEPVDDAEALRFIAAEIAKVHPDSEDEFAAALAAPADAVPEAETETAATDAPADATDAAVDATADAEPEAAKNPAKRKA